MLDLVTDRTQAHVDLLKKLHAKGQWNMTAAELEMWETGEATKGAYNASDLNRVGAAVIALAGQMGVPSGKIKCYTSWDKGDIPTESEMENHLASVKAVRDACPGDVDFPLLPDSMSGLTYIHANNIEKVLSLVDQEIAANLGQSKLGSMSLGWEV